MEDGVWEVENSPGHWIKCETEDDARTISNAPVLSEKSHNAVCPDQTTAAELEATANVLEHYSIGWPSRFFRYRARVLRGEEPNG